MSAVLGNRENRDGDQPVPRREFDKLIEIVIPRLARIEELCFDDTERPSLQTVMTKLDTHLNVMCSWARGLKYVTVGLGTFATSFVAGLHFLHEVVNLWPW